MEKMKYKKKYGQNFLYDENILTKIKKSADITDKDLIIEIGPGSGNLTRKLKEYNCEILAIEIDQTLKEKLDQITNEKTKIIYEDFLNVDLNKILSSYSFQNLYIIANLPYYITTPIITKIIESNINVKAIILMVQKEVANRLSAKPKTKDYGYFTVYINSYYNVEKLFDVSKECFYPVPKVDSSIIKLTPVKVEIADKDKFNNFVKACFLYKRKTLKNNLKNYNLSAIEQVLKIHNLNLSNRAEDIPLAVFLEISKVI